MASRTKNTKTVLIINPEGDDEGNEHPEYYFVKVVNLDFFDAVTIIEERLDKQSPERIATDAWKHARACDEYHLYKIGRFVLGMMNHKKSTPFKLHVKGCMKTVLGSDADVEILEVNHVDRMCSSNVGLSRFVPDRVFELPCRYACEKVCPCDYYDDDGEEEEEEDEEEDEEEEEEEEKEEEPAKKKKKLTKDDK
jgi:hypothetical protein